MSTPSPADLELALRRQGDGAYAVELRYSEPDSDADIRLAQGGAYVAHFDTAQLLALVADPVAYGQALGRQLFAAPDLQAAFAQLRANARTLDAPLRLRLFIDAGAPELHALRWETLRDPADDVCFATGERILFSRYLGSGDWRRVSRRARGELRALVAIANPTDLDAYQLAPVDAKGELQRAATALGPLPLVDLAAGGPVTLDRLAGGLRNGCDILYLVCHGTWKDGARQATSLAQRGAKDEESSAGASLLWLAGDDGKKQIVDGHALLERMNALSVPPLLVVLASCQSAKINSGDSPFAALGPQLAESGVAAVVAMQGNISQPTLDKFMPLFFAELQRDGQIDRAMAVARAAVAARADAWMPALFMRLKSGTLWYVPGFADDAEGFERWPAVISNIQAQRCTPVLGPGLLEALLGSPREIAQQWADKYHFPLAPYAREDLAYVAQYLAVKQDLEFPRAELGQSLRASITQRFAGLPPEAAGWTLDKLIETVGAQRQQQPDEPHRVLAGLPFPIYVTTNPDNLLAQALLAAGKAPEVEICPWNESTEQAPSIFQREPDYQPTVARPLVYHLFGRLSEPDSIVLTEDDYFDYLIGVTRNKDLIPAIVRTALTSRALLFLGFQMDDWNFRVLYRSIMKLEGNNLSRIRKLANVAAQINPEEGRMLEPERARSYLQEYFKGAFVSIYWGTVEDFVFDLRQHHP